MLLNHLLLVVLYFLGTNFTHFLGVKHIKTFKGRSQKKITGLFGNSQNFCKLTKYFFVCQIHSEVLKHVLQRGGGDI